MCNARACLYFILFILWGKKSKKNCSIWGRKSDQVKDKFKKPHKTWCTQGFQLLWIASIPLAPLLPPMVFFASAFGTKKLVSWINWCLLVLSDYSHSVSCFKRKVKTRLLDQCCSSLVSFVIKGKNQTIIWLPKLVYLKPNTILIKAQISF